MSSDAEKDTLTVDGFTTTEFWKSLAVSIVSVLTGLGVIGPSVPDKYRAVIDSAAFIAASITVAGYSLSRSKTKAAAMQATANVITTEKNIEMQKELSPVPVRKPAQGATSERKA